MAEHSTIEWTDATWNPITGCTIVDAGCTNCYAMALAGSRLRNHPSRAGLTRVTGGRSKWTGEVRLNEQWMDQPLRWSRPRRIFVCAHGDLFHEAVPDEWIDRVFAVMALAPQHTFQVLTKRPERARAYLMGFNCDGARCLNIAHAAGCMMDNGDNAFDAVCTAPWPLPNVWLGTSASDQASADLRIPHLLAAPAAVRFLSAEPLLGPLNLLVTDSRGQDISALRGIACDPTASEVADQYYRTNRLDWVIVGGESGPGARPMHPDWARSLRDQCVAAGVPFFFKQWGEWGGGSVNMTTGAPVFRAFPNFQTWVNKASTWVNGGICLDAKGRQCRTGADMMRARDEDAFPVTIMHRAGKSRAGRLLDGQTWDQMPEVRHD
ncbi:MAG: hypothetical protein BGP11_11210 [Rhodobacterales bacterium 65-51]|uniref:DUF5131 family protein n=1 Tax=uncultured Gemmobacter sp. TaxID=1095917 RepID=UPI00095BDEAC|nr:phage Gp37/Gp68 family protein [uncultured Gemmobacter sp.]OJY25782.1 MAG: hypothetical protein BGP11_11210 [Rhodobacterales bacterium 65-51]